MTFQQIIEKRRSMRVFEPSVDVSDAVKRSLELAVLSPNSSNLQVWEFYVVASPELKEQFHKACMKQSAARTANQLVVFVTRQDHWKRNADWNIAEMKKDFGDKELTTKDKRALQYYTRLIPMFYRNDFFGLNTLFRKLVVAFQSLKGPMIRLSNHADQRVMLHKSCALAAQTFMLSMSNEGFDTCPMEGFDVRLVRKLLNLPNTAEVCMIVACGKGLPEGIYNERKRLPNEAVMFFR